MLGQAVKIRFCFLPPTEKTVTLDTTVFGGIEIAHNEHKETWLLKQNKSHIGQNPKGKGDIPLQGRQDTDTGDLLKAYAIGVKNWQHIMIETSNRILERLWGEKSDENSLNTYYELFLLHLKETGVNYTSDSMEIHTWTYSYTVTAEH